MFIMQLNWNNNLNSFNCTSVPIWMMQWFLFCIVNVLFAVREFLPNQTPCAIGWARFVCWVYCVQLIPFPITVNISRCLQKQQPAWLHSTQDINTTCTCCTQYEQHANLFVNKRRLVDNLNHFRCVCSFYHSLLRSLYVPASMTVVLAAHGIRWVRGRYQRKEKNTEKQLHRETDEEKGVSKSELDSENGKQAKNKK